MPLVNFISVHPIALGDLRPLLWRHICCRVVLNTAQNSIHNKVVPALQQNLNLEVDVYTGV